MAALLAWEEARQVESIGEHLAADKQRARAVTASRKNIAVARKTRWSAAAT
jgi:hypothetical protein